MNTSKRLSLWVIILMAATMSVSCNMNKAVEDDTIPLDEWEMVAISENGLDWEEVPQSRKYLFASDSILMSIGDGDTILMRYAIYGNHLFFEKEMYYIDMKEETGEMVWIYKGVERHATPIYSTGYTNRVGHYWRSLKGRSYSYRSGTSYSYEPYMRLFKFRKMTRNNTNTYIQTQDTMK